MENIYGNPYMCMYQKAVTFSHDNHIQNNLTRLPI